MATRNRWLAQIDPQLILWAGATLALSLVVGAVVAAAVLWRDMVRESEAEVRRVGRLLSLHAARVVDPVDHSLREIRAALEASGFGREPMSPARIHASIRPYATVGSHLLRVVVLDAQARLVGASDRAEVPAGIRYDEPWFEQLRRSAPGVAIGAPEPSRISERMVVQLGRSLVDAQTNEFRGAVVASLDLDELQAFHRDLQFADGWQLSLLRDDGTVLVGPRPAADVVPARRLPIDADSSEFVQWRPAGDAELLLSLHRVHGWPLLAAVAVDTATAAAPWRARALAIASITAVAAAGMLLASWAGAGAARRARGLSRSLGVTSARYRSLVESSPYGILLAAGGRIVYANPAMVGLVRAANSAVLLGRRVDDLLDGDDAGAHVRGEYDGPPPSRVVNAERRLRPLHGEPIEVETLIAPGAPADDTTLQIVVRDISARKAALRRLAESEQRYRRMVEGARDCAFLLLDAAGLIEEVSPVAGIAVLGRPQELPGRPLGALFTPDAKASDEPARLLAQAAAGAHPVEREGWCVRTDATRFWAHVVVWSLADAGEVPRGFHVLVRDVSSRKRLQDQLDASWDRLEQLALAAETAREREKVRIARELHDELGQVLTVQQMELDMLADELGSQAPRVRARVSAMRARIEAALKTTRRIAGDLRPLVLDDLGLVAALEWLLEQARTRGGITSELQVRGDAVGLRGETATALFRIAQESLTNVMRHAGARRVQVSLDVEPASVTLRVRDDGCGIGVEPAQRGLGLLGIEERARLLGGQARIEPAEGGGTSVQVQLPCGAAARAAAPEPT